MLLYLITFTSTLRKPKILYLNLIIVSYHFEHRSNIPIQCLPQLNGNIYQN
jgi:hypothetical protein